MLEIYNTTFTVLFFVGCNFLSVHEGCVRVTSFLLKVWNYFLRYKFNLCIPFNDKD